MSLLRQTIRNFEILEAKSENYVTPQVVKEIFHIRSGVAKFILELADRYGLLKGMYVVRCQSCGRIIEWYDTKLDIPAHVDCEAADDHAGFDSVRQNLIERVYVR